MSIVAADGANAVSSDAMGTMAQCSYDCGPPRPLIEMIKTNVRALPICHPCYNSRRAILSAAQKDPVAKEALTRLQQDDPELWKAKVSLT